MTASLPRDAAYFVAQSPQVFDDEYIASGGQLYELMVGHDRFLADVTLAAGSVAAGPSGQHVLE